MAPSLSLDSGWAIGEDAFSAIALDLAEIAPRVIVEFGSGPSSARWAQAFPQAEVVTVEHQAEWCEQLTRQCEEAAVRVEVRHRPLRWQVHAGALYQSYAPGAFPQTVDAVIVDGPPGDTLRGREACLYQVASRLRPGARIYLDDLQRSAERSIVRNWNRAYPGKFSVREFDVGHRIAALTLEGTISAPKFSPVVWTDVNARAARRALTLLRGRTS